MPLFTQKDRQATIDTPLGEDKFWLQKFSGDETISQPFEYTAVLVSEDDAIEGNQLIGLPVSVSYYSEGGEPRCFHGLVNRFEYTGEIETPVKLAGYSMRIVPWLWFLKNNRDCRIFQDMKAPDIIKQIFQQLGYTDFDLSLTESYAEREYCVQYNETDFDFVSRLMQEEGIFYFFEHSSDKHKLVCRDAASGYFDLPDDKVEYRPIGQAHTEQLTSWQHIYEFRPGKVAQKDFNFKDPDDGLLTEEPSTASYEGNSNFEVYEYPGLYTAEGDGKRLTKVRMEELDSEHDYVQSSGYYSSFTPGGKFVVKEHLRESEIGKQYVVTQVSTKFAVPYETSGEMEDQDFENSFRCIPADRVFRPRRTTHKPVVEGPQTAIVVTDGQEIIVDEHARVRVQFHWDRYGQKNIKSSCWIRVSQHHAGAGWGSIDIPRKDEEVIVSFLEGDPDRPIITGRVYNGNNQPPFGLKGAGDNKKNKTRRGNTTKSYEDQGFNEMSMDDTAGKEQIRIHAQYNMDTTVLNDQSLLVKHDRTKTIENDETTTVGNNRTETVQKGNETITIEKGNRSINVNTGNNTTLVEQNNALTVKSGNSSITAESGNHAVTAKKEVQITGHDKLVAIGDNEVSVSGKKISITGTNEITIGVGSNSVVINKQGVSVGGIKITSAAVGVHEISGAMIKIN